MINFYKFLEHTNKESFLRDCGDYFYEWEQELLSKNWEDVNIQNFKHLHKLCNNYISWLFEAIGILLIKNKIYCFGEIIKPLDFVLHNEKRASWSSDVKYAVAIISAEIRSYAPRHMPTKSLIIPIYPVDKDGNPIDNFTEKNEDEKSKIYEQIIEKIIYDSYIGKLEIPDRGSKYVGSLNHDVLFNHFKPIPDEKSDSKKLIYLKDIYKSYDKPAGDFLYPSYLEEPKSLKKFIEISSGKNMLPDNFAEEYKNFLNENIISSRVPNFWKEYEKLNTYFLNEFFRPIAEESFELSERPK